MTLAHYVDVAGNVAISMTSQIYEDHVVVFDPNNTLSTANIIFNSGKTLTFTPANWATPQNLNVTTKRIGSIPIPHRITSAYTQAVKNGQITLTSALADGVVIGTGAHLASIPFSIYEYGTPQPGFTVATIYIPPGSPLLGTWLRISSSFTQSYGQFIYCNIYNPSGGVSAGTAGTSGDYTEVTFSVSGTYKIRLRRTTGLSGGAEKTAYTFTATFQSGATSQFTAARCYCEADGQTAIVNPATNFSISSAPAHQAPVGCSISGAGDGFSINSGFGVYSITGTPSYAGGGTAAGTMSWTGTWTHDGGAGRGASAHINGGCTISSLVDGSESFGSGVGGASMLVTTT